MKNHGRLANNRWFPMLARFLLGPPTLKSNGDINILVVDDELGPREALRMILKDKYNVYLAQNGEEALKKIADVDIDIILLDIVMPRTNGLELLGAIKKAVPDTEVVLITGHPSIETAVEAMQHGAYDYIIKPFNSETVKKVIQNGVIRRTQAQIEKSILSRLLENVRNRNHANEAKVK